MGRIRVLAGSIVDQIAAGEVVERPSSVVKELIENALDAGARNVLVEIDGGGLDRIRVLDDGIGMSREDAPLALARHATSKITTFDDLGRIGTYGFRGEALPSIASVSRLSITTRSATDDEAVRVDAPYREGDDEVRVARVGAPVGTSVEVSDLFVRVPARRKFLRSPQAEAAAVSDAIARAALARPDVRFELHRDGRARRTYLPTTDLVERARSVLPPGVALVEVQGESDGVSVRGVLGSARDARANASALHLIVNGRPVRDRGLVRTVAHAYGERLAATRMPVGVLSVEVARERIDVNVHPQKTEVRFANPRDVMGAVGTIVARALDDTAWVTAARASGASGDDAELIDTDDPWGIGDALRASARALEPLPATSYAVEERPRVYLRALDLVGVVRGRWLVCSDAVAIRIVDRHAATERVLLAKLVEGARTGAIATSECTPTHVPLGRSVDELASAEAELRASGFDWSDVGGDVAIVRRIPAMLCTADPASLFRAVTDALSNRRHRAASTVLAETMGTIACIAASATQSDPVELVRDLAMIDAAHGRSPHERVFVHEAEFDELERLTR